MKESVLFWPVRLQDQALYILDETKIPRSISYIKVSDYRQAIAAVVDMKTRAFGQFLAVCYAFVLEMKRAKDRTKEEQMRILRKVADDFNHSRPTFPFEEVTSMVLGLANKAYTSLYFADEFIGIMQGFLEKGIRGERYRRAEAASKLIEDGNSILTHCHVSGEMSLIGEFCRRDKKRVRFYATETRPYFQGSRLTAWELKTQGFDVTLIPDNAVAKLMTEGRIDRVIVGSDRSAKNGDFANKIGTYQIALLARHFKIPFYALVQPSERLSSGEDIPIEVRDDDEVLSFAGKRLSPKGTAAYYPGFDVVPNALVTKHIRIDPAGGGT